MSENAEPIPPVQPNPLQPAPPPVAESQTRLWNMLCHLSALAGLFIPFGNIIGPLLIWQIKKSEIPSVEAHGKAALNFQLTVLIAGLVGLAAAFLLWIFCIGILFVPVVIAVGICGVVFPIIAGIKANEGKEYRYPYSFNLIA